MTKRKILATATLAALPLFSTVTARPEPVFGPNAEAKVLTLGAQSRGPQWAFAFGMEGGEALFFGMVSVVECSFFGPWGGIACGFTGTL